MFNKETHISDRDLLLMTDGELSTRRTAQIRTHLAACWNCRGRMAEIEGTILEFARACREIRTELPPAASPRALLSARLAELASKSGAGSWRWFGSVARPMRAAAICGALFSVALAVRLSSHYVGAYSPEAMISSSSERWVVPDGRLTPGATRTATIDDLCSSAHEEVVGQVTEPLRNEVLQEYKIANARAGDYEIDYLIAPGLGGTEDIRNLWPQPYSARVWNAYAKDALEERLHLLVCGRELDLTVAQRDIADNWIVAYKKYLQTDEPPRSSAVLNSPRLQAVSTADLQP